MFGVELEEGLRLFEQMGVVFDLWPKAAVSPYSATLFYVTSEREREEMWEHSPG